jgi:hypothetical protein
MVLPQLERNYRDSSHEICFDWLGHAAPGRSGVQHAVHGSQPSRHIPVEATGESNP